jgi:hypothetical protein
VVVGGAVVVVDVEVVDVVVGLAVVAVRGTRVVAASASDGASVAFSVGSHAAHIVRLASATRATAPNFQLIRISCPPT